MRIEHLIEFSVLCETLNYHEASERLFIAQPTLTKHIQELESSLGAPLFERKARGVSLTDFGALVARKTARLLADYEDLLASARLNQKGTLVVGVPLRYTYFSELIAIVRSRFADDYPNVDCRVRDFELDSSPLDLLTHGCDIVLNVLLDGYRDPSIEVAHLCEARLQAWVARNSHINGTSCSLCELAQMTFRPPCQAPDDPWNLDVAERFACHGYALQVGRPLDAQYMLGSMDFGLVFGGSPTSMLGFNARCVEIEESPTVEVAAYTLSGADDAIVASFVGILSREAPRHFRVSSGDAASFPSGR